MKSVLLPADTGALMPSALETARLFAHRFGSTIDGVALRPAFAEIVAPDPIVAVSIPPTDWDEAHYTQQARAVFDAFAAKHPAVPDAVSPQFRWRGGGAIEDSALGSLGRLYDITVIARPGGKGSRMTAFEAALFDSGRPVLMAPPQAGTTLGQSILIHWNCSTETARAIALAMPVLKAAQRVLILTVEGNTVPGPSARDGLGHLSAHGIMATEKTVALAGRNPGEAILAEAKLFGCDLLLKGAYTQSRLRQMIFGGATSHILAKSELPVLFAH
jgi:nucleotide-binding universal stress UspA family protein